RRSSWVSRTWATWRSSSACQKPIRRAWPSAARAWRSAISAPSCGCSRMIARPAATAPEDTTTTSRPIRCAATTKPAIAPAYSVDRPPPLAASRLLPTLSTARRQGGSICSEKSCGAMASAGDPLVEDEVGRALRHQRVAHRDRACLLQRRWAAQQVGAAAAVAEAAAQFEHALRAQIVEEREVWRDQRLVEAGAPHQHDQVTRRAHNA